MSPYVEYITSMHETFLETFFLEILVSSSVILGGQFRAFHTHLPQNGSPAPLAPEISEVVDDRQQWRPK